MSELKVYLLYTGGTIGQTASGNENPTKLEDFIERLKIYPQLYARSGSARGFPDPERGLKYMIDGIKDPIDSSNMKPGHWQDLARRIYDCYDNYDGFIILHGTNTMAFTSSALSFLLQPLKKPIILTGSMKTVFENRNDAVDNILGSLRIAGYLSHVDSIQQVCVFFNSKLFQGNRAVKQSSKDVDAFASPNKPPLLDLNKQVKVNWDTKKADKGALQIFSLKHIPDIRILQLFPGINEKYVAGTLEGADGVVLRIYGFGQIPGDDWFVSLLRKAVISGVLIICTSQCFQGAVHPEAQGWTVPGIILGYDITMEAAVAKLFWALNQSEDSGQRRELMKRNICREMTIPLKV
ncbi:L-asparaginase 1-like isoform X2 [Narcine bancroftii]|uniref:L-asparaginase 1-like isoform X2 n=1 Tax=Narcine bancroftii TaxID=1343680 RepID=UPI003831D081